MELDVANPQGCFDHRSCIHRDSNRASSRDFKNTVETEEVTVTGEATDSLTSGSPEESAKQKMQVPGPFTVKTNDDMELGRASNFEDLLQRIPGVFFNRKTARKFQRFQFEVRDHV